jgi:uncharacterized phiE125 gp8 family phage protein
MYGVEVLAAPTGVPVEAVELREHLRLNDAAEDGLLTEFLASAVELFEHDTDRPVLATTYRQDLSKWPCGPNSPIVLGRGGVTAVAAVRVYQADGSTVDLAADQWRANLTTPPVSVSLASTPATLTTAGGIAVVPVGAVVFTAGWSTPAAVPRQLRVALKLLAGHWYQNREAYQASAFEARTVPEGWARAVSRFKLGISGDWGQ